tara:strand:+ start:557 stop:1660 length:1104 start_codon:yes stop_codon:yes gene_type:complete
MKNKLNSKVGWTTISYDQNEFPFAKIIEKKILEFLNSEHGSNLDRLEDLHLDQSVIQNLEIVRQKMFSIFREEEFQNYYKSFAKFLIETYADKSALIQKTPTARIQPPRFMTTSFHSDAWYGHSKSTNSFWMPLTKVNADNTLNMAPSRELSNITMNKLIQGNYSLKEINDICIAITEPSKTKKGQILSFGPDMIHGAKMNTSDLTRVSFDFRIVNSDKDLGFKPISNYYRYDDLTSDKKEIEKVQTTKKITQGFLSYSNSCSGVNPKSQLMLCSSVAKDKGLVIQRNESEIYVFDYLPVLRHYLGNETPTFDGVIVFSIAIFNGNKDLGEQILNLAKQNLKQILFAAEDILFTHKTDNKVILNKIS